MDEIVKMSQNKEFLVMDVVAACVNLMTSDKKRANLVNISRALWNIYEMNESSCETLLEALILERKILRIKGKTEYFFENARNFKDFTLRVLEGDGIVTTHAEKFLAGVEGDQIHYEQFEKFLLETGEFKDAEEVKFGLLEDIIDKKVELENDGEEIFWEPNSEETINDVKSMEQPSETEISSASEPVPPPDNIEETPSLQINEVSPQLEELQETPLSESEETALEVSPLENTEEIPPSNNSEEVPPSGLQNVEEVLPSGSESLLEISEMPIKSCDINSTLIDTSLTNKSSVSPEQMKSSMSPEQMKSSLSPEQMKSSMSPEQMKSSLSPEPMKSSVSPKEMKSSMSPEQMKSSLSPEPMKSSVSPKEMKTALSPEPMKSSVSPKEMKSALSPEQMKSSVSPQQMKSSLSSEPTKSSVSPKEIKSSLSPEQMKSSVSPKEMKSAVSPEQMKSAEPLSDLGVEDHENEYSRSKKMKMSEPDVPKFEEIQVKIEPKVINIKKEKCEEMAIDEPQEVEAKPVHIKPDPDAANVKIKEEPTSDDENQNSSRSRSSRQRSRGYSDLPTKKSSRVSNKKFDDDYYFPSLKRKTITRRKKTGSPEPVEVKKEPSAKKSRPTVRQNPGTKCPICKTACKLNDIPVGCIECGVNGHPACVEQEQMLFLNVDQFDRMNWTCEDCRISTPEKGPKARDISANKSDKCLTCGGINQLECRCSTKEVEDKKFAPERGDMRSDMVVIRGLESTTPVSLIWNEMTKRGFHPTKVVNALSKSKDPLDMFFVVIPNLASDSKIYKISRLLNQDVKILRPFQLKKKSSDAGLRNDTDYDVVGKNVPDLLTVPSSITIEKRKKKSLQIEDNDLPKYSPKIEVSCEPSVCLEVIEIPDEDKKCEVMKSMSSSPQRLEIMESDSSSNICDVPEKPSKVSQEEKTIVLIPGRKEWKFPPRWVNRLNRPVPDPEVPDCIAWTTEQVADYFATYFNEEVSKKFLEHDIDGYALKLLTRGNVLVEFGLNLGLALRVLFHVKRLQIRTNDRALIYMDES